MYLNLVNVIKAVFAKISIFGVFPIFLCGNAYTRAIFQMNRAAPFLALSEPKIDFLRQISKLVSISTHPIHYFGNGAESFLHTQTRP